MSYNHPAYMMQELQRQLVDAHAAYQRSMTDSHLAFMQTVNQIAMQLNGQMMPVQALPPAPVAIPAPAFAPVSPPAPVFSNPPAPAVMMPQAAAWTPAPAPAPVSTLPPAAAPHSVPPASQVSTKQNAGLDLQKTLVDIIAEKTGYPAEMLTMDMGIEADLGIDSIKRVEILSTVSEKIPNLPEMKPENLGEINTLGDILSFMQKHQMSPQPA